MTTCNRYGIQIQNIFFMHPLFRPDHLWTFHLHINNHEG